MTRRHPAFLALFLPILALTATPAVASAESSARAWQLGGWIAAGWVLAFLVLLLAGFALSAVALRVASRLPRAGVVTAMPRSLRATYRAVLWLSCAFYYVSLPFVMLSVVALGGLAIWGLASARMVPVKLILIVGVVVVVSLWAMLKSLFVRGNDEDPGERLDLGRQPRLRAALDEVAGKVGTRAIDDVFMTPGTDVAVFERGGVSRQLRGSTRRCLVLGAGILSDLRVPAFKSVLAHEFGHLTNRDTAGGGFALTVRRSLVTMAQSLARGGAATWYNPTWWFVNGYFRVFLRISQGASRLQEVMADRWAAACYGSEAFVEGLTAVIRGSVTFDAHANAALNHVIQSRLPLENLYRHALPKPLPEIELEKARTAALAGPGSPYDSHPRPADRLAWVRALAVPAPPARAGDDADAWSLLDDRDGIERRMTARVRAMVAARHGQAIAG